MPAITRSSAFGRSTSTTRSTVTGAGHTRRIQLPAFPPTVAHSFDESPGYPAAEPSTAFTAVWPEAVFCDDAVTDTPAIRATFADVDGLNTVTITESVDVNAPSDTVNWNVYPPATVGVNVGLAAVALLNATPGPPVCAHCNDNAVPSGSDDADPSNVTTAPVSTD